MGKALVSKEWVQSEITVQALEWKKTNRGGEGFKDMEFSGVLKK